MAQSVHRGERAFVLGSEVLCIAIKRDGNGGACGNEAIPVVTKEDALIDTPAGSIGDFHLLIA